ncbi:MAG: hypothetical protein Q8O55_03270 [Dehalococcoidales bacterium]|nr:hypothetical protein [Dehalococcoidales bacterium]
MDWLSPVRELFEFGLPFLDRLPFIRAGLGIALVFFLPGFAWTLVFFRKVTVLERIALSFALSIAVVTLSLLFASRLGGFSLNGFNSVLVIIVITILPLVIYYLNRLINRGNGEQDEDV